MKKIVVAATAILSMSILPASAQKNRDPHSPSKLYLGAGTGQVYGGLIGLNFSFEPVKGLGVMAGGGYFLAGLGYNGGVYYRFLADKKVNPLVYGLFGTNAAIKVVGTNEYDKLYIGPSFGAGTIFKVGRGGKNRLFLGVHYMLRSKDFDRDIEIVNDDPRVDGLTRPLPVSFNFGFHFPLVKKG